MSRQPPARRKRAFHKETTDWLTGIITRWQDGENYGFITGNDGASYFVSGSDLPAGTSTLPVGTAIRFTSPAAPEPGKKHLRARAVRPLGEP